VPLKIRVKPWEWKYLHTTSHYNVVVTLCVTQRPGIVNSSS
jgi:hypothetical protein